MKNTDKKKLKAGAGAMANATKGKARTFKSKKDKPRKKIIKEFEWDQDLYSLNDDD